MSGFLEIDSIKGFDDTRHTLVGDSDALSWVQRAFDGGLKVRYVPLSSFIQALDCSLESLQSEGRFPYIDIGDLIQRTREDHSEDFLRASASRISQTVQPPFKDDSFDLACVLEAFRASKSYFVDCRNRNYGLCIVTSHLGQVSLHSSGPCSSLTDVVYLFRDVVFKQDGDYIELWNPFVRQAEVSDMRTRPGPSTSSFDQSSALSKVQSDNATAEAPDLTQQLDDNSTADEILDWFKGMWERVAANQANASRAREELSQNVDSNEDTREGVMTRSQAKKLMDKESLETSQPTEHPNVTTDSRGEPATEDETREESSHEARRADQSSRGRKLKQSQNLPHDTIQAANYAHLTADQILDGAVDPNLICGELLLTRLAPYYSNQEITDRINNVLQRQGKQIMTSNNIWQRIKKAIKLSVNNDQAAFNVAKRQLKRDRAENCKLRSTSQQDDEVEEEDSEDTD